MAIIVVYFSMTSLSTVGFGDLNPRSDGERLVCSMALLFGVAIFSYFMGHIIEILEQNLKYGKELGDDEGLAKFFGCIQRFNNNKRLNQNFKQEIEQFFYYKWKHDKNLSINSDFERRIFDELPHAVQDKLYTGYLYVSFLSNFRLFFQLKS